MDRTEFEELFPIPDGVYWNNDPSDPVDVSAANIQNIMLGVWKVHQDVVDAIRAENKQLLEEINGLREAE